MNNKMNEEVKLDVEVYQRYCNGESIKDLALKYDVSQSMILKWIKYYDVEYANMLGIDKSSSLEDIILNEEFFVDYEISADIMKSECSSYTKSGDGCTIYLEVKNKSSKPIDVVIEKTFIINSKREQRNMDYYLTEYQFNEEKIYPNAKCVRGDIYLESTSGKLENGWQFCVEISDKTNGRKYNIIFKMISFNNWDIVSLNVEEIEKVLDKKVVKASLKDKIERIEAFEQRMGVRLENISLQLSGSELEIYFDVYEISPESLKKYCYVNIVIYDNYDEILAKKNVSINPDSFMGFESKKIIFFDFDSAKLSQIGRIRVYMSL